LTIEERGTSQERALWIPGGRHLEVDFGVERHTLVTGKIIQIFHRTSTSNYLVCSSEGALVQVEGTLIEHEIDSTCPIQGESSDSLLTQLRGGKDTSIS
jgi:hypothetical protein